MTDTRRNETSPALSPDGRTIAFVVGWLGARDLWLMNADTTNKRQLTFDAADDYGPRWSPDGKHLAFSSTRTGNEDIYVMTDDGSGLSEAHVEDVTNRPAFDQYPDWSSDGSRLALSTNYWGGRDIETIDPAHPAAAVRQLTSGPEYDWQPAWSPDGVHIAFASGPESGPFHAYAMTAAGTAVHRLTSGPQEELQPDYSPDGSRVVYASGPTDATELLTGPADGGQSTPLTKGHVQRHRPRLGRHRGAVTTPAAGAYREPRNPAMSWMGPGSDAPLSTRKSVRPLRS